MEAQQETRRRAQEIASHLLSEQAKGRLYTPTWSKMVTAAANQKPIPEPKMPSIRQMGIKGQCAKAIQEAYSGEKARKEATERLGRILGMSYLMLTECMQLIDEAEHMMERTLRDKMHLGVSLRKMNLAFDEFADRMKEHISASHMVKFREDLEAFDANVRTFADLGGYRVETKEDRRKMHLDRAKNLHLDFIDKMLQIREEFGEQAVNELMETLKEIDKEKGANI